MASTSDAPWRGHRACRPAAPLTLTLTLTFMLLAGLTIAQGAAAQQACAVGASSLPSARFQDNGDGTVTDAESKLMWMRCSSGQQWRGSGCAGTPAAYSWVDAQRQADQISRDGSAFFNDWRVPTLRDLATITDRACKNPRTNLAVFPATPAAPFWSSTPRPGEASEDRGLALSFGPDGVMVARRDERFHLRLVRSAR